jgi:ABC-type sugar transport system ATPase subunit
LKFALFGLIDTLKQNGIAVLFISQKLADLRTRASVLTT